MQYLLPVHRPSRELVSLMIEVEIINSESTSLGNVRRHLRTQYFRNQGVTSTYNSTRWINRHCFTLATDYLCKVYGKWQFFGWNLICQSFLQPRGILTKWNAFAMKKETHFKKFIWSETDWTPAMLRKHSCFNANSHVVSPRAFFWIYCIMHQEVLATCTKPESLIKNLSRDKLLIKSNEVG